MYQSILRDGLGRIIGSLDNEMYFDSEDSWEDIKCYDVRFPEYRTNLNGECVTYSIEELTNESNKNK